MALHSFEDLLTADKDILKKTIAEFSVQDTVLALKGASPDMNDLIVRLLPEKKAAALSGEHANTDRVPLVQVEQAQERILQTYRRLLQARQENT